MEASDIAEQHNGPGVSPGPITCVRIVIDPLSWSILAHRRFVAVSSHAAVIASMFS
jgi:hypothetical protein